MNDSVPFPLEIRYTIQSRSKFLFSIQNSSLLNTYRMRTVLIILDTTSKICKYICVSDAIHSCYQTYTFVSFYGCIFELRIYIYVPEYITCSSGDQTRLFT